MATVRAPAVAGSFYAEDPVELRETIGTYLDRVVISAHAPKAMVAPHAGYHYSGAVAASAYAQLSERRADIDRVVLLGPSHRVYFKGLALASAAAYATPLGEVSIDQRCVAALTALPQVRVLDAAHAAEHSLEVHLPFLQETLDDFTLVPIVVGEACAAEVAEAIETVWGAEETLIVVSSDLSHFLDYDAAVRADAETSRSIEARREDIEPEQACGCRPLNGLLHIATRHGLTVSTIDLRNSGDTAGPRHRVVGYGAYLLT